MTERIKAFVQHAREREISFRAFHVYLNEFLFDVRHFVIEIVRRRERRFEFFIVAETKMERFDLRLDNANGFCSAGSEPLLRGSITNFNGTVCDLPATVSFT